MSKSRTESKTNEQPLDCGDSIAELTAEVNELKLTIESYRVLIQAAEATIAALQQQRDEARALAIDLNEACDAYCAPRLDPWMQGYTA